MNDHYMEVLQKYEGEALEVRRGRGAWLCIYPDRIRLLKEYRGSLKRLEFEEAVLQQVRERGVKMVDCCIRNQDGELLTTAGDGSHYIVKEWYLEKECSMNEQREILTAVTWIARLHRALREVEWNPEWNLSSMLPASAASEMLRHNREMKRVRSFVGRQHQKKEFELGVLKSFDWFYAQACEAQEELWKLEERQVRREAYLCHGDLNHHHVLIRGSEAGFIEFSQMHRGEQMQDLYHFMRKAMEKHNWSERLGMAMIEQYHAESAMSKEDRRTLYYLFLYPEKYWKQLNYYNNSNKAWIPERSVEKLRGLKEQEGRRQQFLTKMERQMN